MAEQTSSSVVIEAPASAVMAVIADFEAYPSWAQGMKRVEVLETGEEPVAGSATPSEVRATRVAFDLDVAPIKDSYTLAYDWDGDREVRWHLVEGRILKAMQGSYRLAPGPDPASTEVTYRLTVDVAIPLIGMLRRKAEKVIIDTALNGLKKRVEAQR